MSDEAPRPVAVIASAHMNAVGIAQSLREIGWRGRVVALNAEADTSLAGQYPQLCETWRVRFDEPSELLGLLKRRLPHDVRKVVFFTSEQYMPAIAADPEAWAAANVLTWFGAHARIDTILNRKRFYDFVASRGLAPVPVTLSAAEKDASALTGPFRARVWYSWRGMKRLPRGMNVRGDEDRRAWEEQVRREGLAPSEWGWQELLSTDPLDNVSVSGWHDGRRRIYLASRKVIQTRDNGRLVERVADPGRLFEQTEAILSALEFAGPFELEFIRDPRTLAFKVLELNPRFWMQHRLIARLTDNALVRRYVGAAAGASAALNGRGPRYWLDTNEMLPEVIGPGGFIRHCGHLWSGVWSNPCRAVLRQSLRKRYRFLRRVIGVQRVTDDRPEDG